MREGIFCISGCVGMEGEFQAFKELVSSILSTALKSLAQTHNSKIRNAQGPNRSNDTGQPLEDLNMGSLSEALDWSLTAVFIHRSPVPTGFHWPTLIGPQFYCLFKKILHCVFNCSNSIQIYAWHIISTQSLLIFLASNNSSNSKRSRRKIL